ncbi:MAG TPA: hypothetical protein VFN07_08665 [Trueperaceae bacterium]|nr:hypothetical protein [Trueperaceae bacterium]
MGLEPQFWHRITDDPILFYSACATVLLGLFALGTGLARGDFLVLTRPRSVLRVLGAVISGFLLLLLADNLVPATAPAWVIGSAAATSRVPLYVIALAFGPSVGLLAGALFAAATAGGVFPGMTETLFTFELIVLGWLAIYPSPRVARWAGPFDVIMAHVLTWGTAGILWLTYQEGGVSVGSLLSASAQWPAELLVAAGITYLVAPRWYAVAFPHSRVEPESQTQLASTGRRANEQLDVFATRDWHPKERQHTELVTPRFRSDDPNS